jgi:hypothetical protein
VLPFSTILTIFVEKSYPPFGGFSATSATRQVQQRWFSVCIFPLWLLFGLTGNRLQLATFHTANVIGNFESNTVS